MNASALECRDFSFFYGSHRVLNKISFAVERSAWLTIIGPNGSGKSTLVKNMLRLVEGRSTGELRIHARPINAYSQIELARMLAYMPQAVGGIPPFTVRDFVNLSRYPFCYRGSAREERNSECVNRALDITGTAPIASQRLDQLSGGQRQRAYLAAALAQNTDILLLDEPASFLDPKHVYALNEMLKSLHREWGMTIITVTHDLNQPLDVGGLALVLRGGERIFFGEACELVEGKGILEEAFEHKFSYLTHPITHKPLVVA